MPFHESDPTLKDFLADIMGRQTPFRVPLMNLGFEGSARMNLVPCGRSFLFYEPNGVIVFLACAEIGFIVIELWSFWISKRKKHPYITLEEFLSALI